MLKLKENNHLIIEIDPEKTNKYKVTFKELKKV